MFKSHYLPREGQFPISHKVQWRSQHIVKTLKWCDQKGRNWTIRKLANFLVNRLAIVRFSFHSISVFGLPIWKLTSGWKGKSILLFLLLFSSSSLVATRWTCVTTTGNINSHNEEVVSKAEQSTFRKKTVCKEMIK